MADSQTDEDFCQVLEGTEDCDPEQEDIEEEGRSDESPVDSGEEEGEEEEEDGQCQAPEVDSIPQELSTSGMVIFRDDFESLNFKKWRPFSGMPRSNQGFQAYIPDERVIFVKDGQLHIKPMLTIDHPKFGGSEEALYTKTLNLKGMYGKCNLFWLKGGNMRKGSEEQILPPIMSGRVHSAASLKYGVVEVRAKIPVGDWLWPAIWMRPKNSPYKGGWPRDGEIDLMESRGNIGSWDVGMVRSAVHYGTSSKDRKSAGGKKKSKSWHDDFHVYKLVWTPDYIETYVDDQRMMHFGPGPDSTLYDKGKLTGPNIYAKGERMAPFDQQFYLILNVAVGGTGGTFGGNRRYAKKKIKPWKNKSPDPYKDFWDDREDWLATWNGDETALIIDYVEFRSL